MTEIIGLNTETQPFNHGTASIAFEPVGSQEKMKLLQVLENNWGVAGEIKQVAPFGFTQKNFLVVTPWGRFNLKQFDSRDYSRELANACMDYCHQNNSLTPAPLVDFFGRTMAFDSAYGYSLFDWIEGEHFDGSRAELINGAVHWAKLHRVLNTWPGQASLITNGSILKHHREKLIPAVIKLTGDDSLEALSQRTISSLNQVDLPFQAIHREGHPHNFLFDPETKRLRAILDYERIVFSQRIRCVAFTLHRLARTYGQNTEKQQDIGASFSQRASQFLASYLEVNPLSREEILAIPVILIDEYLDRLTIIAENQWTADLPKMTAMLKEAEELSVLAS